MAHRHCWADYRASLEPESEEWYRAWAEGIDATCLLPADHPGEHVWTPDRELEIEFGNVEAERVVN